jgi:aerobic carbon-monoxide dehydrogenase medium subunit
MKRFTYLEPHNLSEALELLGKHGPEASIIAGGQSLLLALKARLKRPAHLVSVAAIPEMHGWRYNAQGELECGAALTYAKLASAQLRGWHCEIARVASDLADDCVRNMATIGGAACQAEPRFDVPALLVGLNARLTINAKNGAHVVDAEQFFNHLGGTRLAPAEILTTITFPALQTYSKVVFEKFRVQVFDPALVSIVCALRLDATDMVAGARITIGAVEKAPVSAVQSASDLVGRALPRAADRGLGERIADEVIPRETRGKSPRGYQSELIKALTCGAMRRAGSQTSKGSGVD